MTGLGVLPASDSTSLTAQLEWLAACSVVRTHTALGCALSSLAGAALQPCRGELFLQQEDLQFLRSLPNLRWLNLTHLREAGDVLVEKVVAALPHVEVEQNEIRESNQVCF